MSEQQQPVPSHLDHNAPLRALVKGLLHKDRTLADNVRRLRFKRRKPAKAEAEVQP